MGREGAVGGRVQIWLEVVGGVMGVCEARGYLRESRGFSGIEVPTSRMMLLGTRQLFSTSPRPCVSPGPGLSLPPSFTAYAALLCFHVDWR